MARLGDGGLYSDLKAKLDKSNGGRSSNIKDALIAETAIMNGLTLVTDDRDLYKIVMEYQSPCVRLDEILKRA